MATQYFDALETRDPELRERMQFAALPRQVAYAQAAAPAFARILAGIDASAVTSRAALAGLPVTRKSELLELQKEARPFGGFAASQSDANRGSGGVSDRTTRVRVARTDLRARRRAP